MLINANKPGRWKADVTASVDMYNEWFMRFAPQAFRTERTKTTKIVLQAMLDTEDLRKLTPEDLEAHPGILSTLRMATAPPIARDRLVGLAKTTRSLVDNLEAGVLPPRMKQTVLRRNLDSICRIIDMLLDRDLFVWLPDGRQPDDIERERAASVVADRLCGARADPIVRNAQEARQLNLVEQLLQARGYVRKPHPASSPLHEMEPGTFSFRMIVVARFSHEQAEEIAAEIEDFSEPESNTMTVDDASLMGLAEAGVVSDVEISSSVGESDVTEAKRVNIPIDVVIQPKELRPSKLPILVEAKSAGDFANTNKRRKEEAVKLAQLRATYGPEINLILLLCGYFNPGYLGYSAAESLDWVWEHRIEDLLQAGI